MDSFPLFLKLKGQRCLVVGGGEIARHKADLLIRAHAAVEIVAPELHPSTRELIDQHRLEWHARRYRADDLEGCRLVVAATDNNQVNTCVAADAEQRNMLVNVVDMPTLGNCIFPSILDRSPLTIAIGSNGSAPVLVRQLRARLETLIPASYGKLAQLVANFRQQTKQRYPEIEGRRRFWDKHLQGRAAELVFAGQETEASQLIAHALAYPDNELARGEVYLVGGGPGDPDLLTFKALRLMQQCDLVLYDRLVSAQVLDLVRRESERVYVGKDKNPYSITQENINQAMVDFARQGKRVLRLKGGDPFVFGRGGEEMQFLAQHQIPFQVVPGITAASGCASYSGIPLTHRDHAQSVQFIAGHHRGGELNLDWERLVATSGQTTLVFYMGLNGLETICQQLLAHGMPSTTPTALVEKGTLPDQRLFVAPLQDIAAKVRNHRPEAPTLIIVGAVVGLSEELAVVKNVLS